jgi:hypothetical protein
MKAAPNCPNHECCPKDWRGTPNFTGSHELDAVIARNGNGNLPARMRLYAAVGERDAYGPRTAYNGYAGYSGDD